MAWLWNTWEEYVSAVAPVEVGRGAFNATQVWTRLDSIRLLLNAEHELRDARDTLHNLGFKNHKEPNKDPAISAQARHSVIVAINSGERLLLYHRRLALR